jgi:hypothetical protein
MIFQNFGFNRVIIPEAAAGGGVVTSGLIAYYDIGNAGGYTGTTLNDLSGTGNNGTLVNGAAYSGSNGGVISLNGTTQYIVVPDSVGTEIANTNAASIQIWIKLQTSPPAADAQTGFMQFTKQNNGIGVHYPYTDNNIYINTLKDYRPSYGTPITDLTQWHYTTITTKPTDQGGTWDFYINTGSQGTDGGLNALSVISPITIGRDGGGNDIFLQGAIGPILIYNRKITTTERDQNASYFSSRF